MYPILFQVGGVVVPSYFAVISMAFMIGQLWLYRRVDQLQLPRPTALDLALILMVAGFVGGRLGHVIYEYPQYYLESPIRILFIWRGGFVFYGGALVAALGCALYARWHKLAWGPWADLFAPIMVLVYAIGRVGSFLSGSCYGRPTSLPWAVRYPEGVEAPAHVALHPATLYETLWSLGVVAILLAVEKNKRLRPGGLFDLMLILHGFGRIGLEYFRGDYRGPLLAGQTVSTLLSLVLVLVGLIRLLRLRASS